MVVVGYMTLDCRVVVGFMSGPQGSHGVHESTVGL